jgi:hypothetical protein
MSEAVHKEILGSFDERQLAVLRVSIMAERRLRTHYQRDPSDTPSLKAAYVWAREQVP